jgi:hypothetical protein
MFLIEDLAETKGSQIPLGLLSAQKGIFSFLNLFGLCGIQCRTIWSI